MTEYTSEFIKSFWSKIQITTDPDECWLWLAGKYTYGYGQVWLNNKPQGSHRISYELVYGEFDKNLHVLHSCDNPPCCNPNHLFLGTPLDNAQDRDQKGRSNRCKKLTFDQVQTIRELYLSGEISYSNLSILYKVGKSQIARIIRNEQRLFD